MPHSSYIGRQRFVFINMILGVKELAHHKSMLLVPPCRKVVVLRRCRKAVVLVLA